MSVVPISRIQSLNDESINPNGEFVLYWMIAFRRPCWNFSLQRAVELAKDHRKPILVLEALRTDDRWASDRIHQFVIDGMIDNGVALKKTLLPTTLFGNIDGNRKWAATPTWQTSSSARKVQVKNYVAQYAPDTQRKSP